MLLYVITDRAWLGEQTLSQQVEQALKGGATFVQLREKELPFEEFLSEAKKVKEITDAYHVPFIINDNLKVAIACDADGVHIGQDDIPVQKARNLIGEDKILGVSAQTVEQALKAEQDGADYLGVGAVFSTSTKTDAQSVSFQTLQNICKSVSIPVVAIGGINDTNILKLIGSGINGVSVISAVFAKPNITEATQRLLALSKQMVNSKS